MKKRFHILHGKTDLKGNFLASMESFKKWAAENPNARIVARFDLIDNRESELLKTYFRECCIPEMQFAYAYSQGERLTTSQVCDKILESCPFCQDEKIDPETGKIDHQGIKWFYDMPVNQQWQVVEWLKYWAAENFDHYLPDPK